MSNVNDQMLQSGFAAGGMKQDPVSGNEVPVGALPHEVRDDVDAKLSEGEFVIPADVVRFIGLQKLMQLRDKAKEGLARMAEMGQMGNSEEAKANGEDPLGEFEDGEDDDGFEAEIDDIIGKSEDGEVEMAEGGDVPGTTTVTGQNTGGDNAWLWKPTEQNTRYVPYNLSTGKWGDGAESFMPTDRITPEIAKYLRAIGYTGPLADDQALKSYAIANTPGGEAALAGGGRSALEARNDALTNGWQPDKSVWNPFDRNTELEQFLRDKGLNLEVGVHQVPNASQKTTIQRIVGADGKPVAVDAYNDRYNASDRGGDLAKLALVGMGIAAASGVGAGAAGEGAAATGATETAATEGIKFLDPALAGTKPVVTTQGLTAADIGFGKIGAGGAFSSGLTGGAELSQVPMSGEAFGKSAGEVLKDKAIDKMQSEAVKEGVKQLAPAPSPSKQSGIPSWLVGAGLGAAAGSALGGGSSSSTPSSKTEIPRGNNPVVDYRPADAQTEELFINNRPTGKKKKKGFAVGGDVNLDAYNFFNQQD